MLHGPECNEEVNTESKRCANCLLDLSDITVAWDDTGNATLAAKRHEEPHQNTPAKDRTAAILTAVGSYRVLGFIGKGGMGHVYRALQPNPRREVALKLLSQGRPNSETDRLRLDGRPRSQQCSTIRISCRSSSSPRQVLARHSLPCRWSRGSHLTSRCVIARSIVEQRLS